MEDFGQAWEIANAGVEYLDARGEELVAGAEGGDAGGERVGHYGSVPVLDWQLFVRVVIDIVVGGGAIVIGVKTFYQH